MPRTNTPSDNHDEVDLLQAARIEIGSAEDVLSAFTAVLRLICERTGSKIGQMWMPNEEGTALERRAVWPTNGNGSVKEFIAASGRMTFPRDAGLPGRIWSIAEPAWVLDIRADSNFPRISQAEAAGITTALGIPVLDDREVVAVLEFFFCERREPDDQLTVLIATVAAQLGSAIRHKRAYDRLRASEERYRALVENAPICIHEIDPVSRLHAAGLRQRLDLGPICRKLHLL